MKTKKEIITERLYELYYSYVDMKNDCIKKENEIIDKRNQEILDHWKRQIQRPEKPMLRQKIKNYTQEQFMTDFEAKTGISLYRSKLSKYLDGTTCPPETTLYAFADFFHVSIDYLIGNTDIKNPTTASISEILNLTETATNTLITCGKNPIVTTVLNALLSNEDTAQYMFMNLYEQAYQSYKKKSMPDSYGDYDADITLRNMANAVTFNRYLEDNLTMYLTPEYAKRLQDDINYEYWRSLHYDEYEADIISNIEEATPSTQGTIKAILITPDNKKDSQ